MRIDSLGAFRLEYGHFDSDPSEQVVSLHVQLTGEFDEDNPEEVVRAVAEILARIPVRVLGVRKLEEEPPSDQEAIDTIEAFLRELNTEREQGNGQTQ